MNGEAMQHTQLDGAADYIAALDTICSAARHTLYIFEKNFDGIGFNSEARHEALRRFLLANSTNRLHLLAHDPQPLLRFCPRMLILLRQFGHGMAIHRTPPHLQNIAEPFAVADEANYVRRYHFDDPRGLLARNDPEGARVLKSRFEEMWGSSHPAASGTTLGL